LFEAWICDGRKKIDLFASTWASKSEIPASGDVQFFGAPSRIFNVSLVIRARDTEKELARLDTDKATGPDRISAKILKMISKEFAIPMAKLCRRMLNEG